MTDSSIVQYLGKLDQKLDLLTQEHKKLDERISKIQHEQQNKRSRSQMETETAEMEKSVPGGRHTMQEAEEKLKTFKANESHGFKNKLENFARAFHDDVW